ncbi:FAD-dependent monooxygenase [Amycolatopsis alkalitolerans]|uniref:FAD-dependent monooxygenase n=1 Tax=Amycolatopsis alkalitolerans TaxID=2547244 RepID=UPI00190F716F|nr:FAD-dependent monooxygenase [Amycolatopsis alkalitolerans]
MHTRLDALEAMFGVPAFALHRADLHQLLTDSVQDAELRTGHRVLNIAQRPDGRATVTYERPDGESTATAEVTADLVVAADGLHSTIRTTLLPAYPGPAYAGYVVWRGIVPAERAAALEQHAVTETWGRGQRFGIVPLTDGRTYWFAAASAPAGTHTDDELAGLQTRYRDWHRPIPELLAATPPAAVLRHDIYYLRQPLPTYVANRVALLGDAAHAMTPDLGQGACLALEDAATLAGFAREPDIDAALRRYDHARRPRTQRLVRESARIGRIAAWSHPAAAAFRNALVSLIPARRYLRSSADTYAWTPPPDPDAIPAER